MNESRLLGILGRPLSSEDWPNLQAIIKHLNEYITQKAKIREYVQAQRAKEKVIQAMDEIKRRSRYEADERERMAVQQLKIKHEDEKIKLQKQFEVRRKKVENQFTELIQRKKQKQYLEKEKHLQQIEIALPLNNSPDRELHHLKHQEQQAVQCGDFIEAQRLKMQIINRQTQLSRKYQKLRESNIKTMMSELENKQNIQLLTIEARRDERIIENDRTRGKKMKQLVDRQDRQMKEMLWVYAEEKKKIK